MVSIAHKMLVRRGAESQVHSRAKRTSGSDMSAEEIRRQQELISRYQSSVDHGRDDLLAKDLVETFTGLIKNIALYFKPLVQRCPGLGLEDLEAAGKLGLVNGLRTYKPESSLPSTYLSTCILNSMIGSLRTLTNKVFSGDFRLLLKIHKMKQLAIEVLRQSGEKNVDNAVLASRSGIDVNHLNQLDELYDRFLDAQHLGEFEFEVAALKLRGEERDDQKRVELRDVVDSLCRKRRISGKQKQLLYLRFGLEAGSVPLVLEDIGKILRVNKRRVSQLLEAPMQTLREYFKPLTFIQEEKLGFGPGVGDFVKFTKKLYLDYLTKNEAWSQFSKAFGGFLAGDLSDAERKDINESRALREAKLRGAGKNLSALAINELATEAHDLAILYRIMYRDYCKANTHWLSFTSRLLNWAPSKDLSYEAFLGELFIRLRDLPHIRRKGTLFFSAPQIDELSNHLDMIKSGTDFKKPKHSQSLELAIKKLSELYSYDSNQARIARRHLTYKDFLTLLLKRASELKFKLTRQSSPVLSLGQYRLLRALTLTDVSPLIEMKDALKRIDSKASIGSMVLLLRNGANRFYNIYNQIRSGMITEPSAASAEKSMPKPKMNRLYLQGLQEALSKFLNDFSVKAGAAI